MLENEKFAIAAHLHVLLRRKVGRVTDVEWLVKSHEYAIEVIRIARAEKQADLDEWANKLEGVLLGGVRPTARQAPAQSPLPAAPARQAFRDSEFDPGSTRYVGRLR
ncbi:hypothetical protein [Piscinibacter sp. HJYY11]|uniref:hypothetical protein n=1 Tax=Piscinibacter sp. HJYY11 TaxID=2801333 RepID=UPI00191E4741|nr:hypothetical protein [Piscinibacter sp. HJYY11]MBL0726672.1 hypothetical protein [Piscinibacter sp. HJYY11]